VFSWVKWSADWLVVREQAADTMKRLVDNGRDIVGEILGAGRRGRLQALASLQLPCTSRTNNYRRYMQVDPDPTWKCTTWKTKDQWLGSKSLDLTANRVLSTQLVCISAYILRQLRPSVCLSNTWVVSKRLNIEILPVYDRPAILVFRQQGLLRKSDGITRSAEYKGDFRPICR